jgi:hypothetical protein
MFNSFLKRESGWRLVLEKGGSERFGTEPDRMER